MSVITKKRGKRQFVRDPLKFKKRRKLFVATNDETVSVIAVRVSNPDCAPVRIHG
jgi:hypothetical protein